MFYLKLLYIYRYSSASVHFPLYFLYLLLLSVIRQRGLRRHRRAIKLTVWANMWSGIMKGERDQRVYTITRPRDKVVQIFAVIMEALQLQPKYRFLPGKTWRIKIQNRFAFVARRFERVTFQSCKRSCRERWKKKKQKKERAASEEFYVELYHIVIFFRYAIPM